MTVRWKPLLVLSGLFLVIAVVGVVAIAYTLIPRGSSDILPQARAARSAKEYEKALIHYKRALQKDGRNAAIHEEIAKMYGEWAEQVPPEKQSEIQYKKIESLIAAARYGQTLKEPRRLLLADAIRRGVRPDCLLWANELHRLEPANVDARYVLASEAARRKNAKNHGDQASPRRPRGRQGRAGPARLDQGQDGPAPPRYAWPSRTL